MKSKVERIMHLVLDQEAWNVFGILSDVVSEQKFNAQEHRRMGAYLLQDNLRKHFSKHIQSFNGKTMFDSANGIEGIKDILKRKMSVYIRKFDNAYEKAGAIKMYEHIQKEFKNIMEVNNMTKKEEMSRGIKILLEKEMTREEIAFKLEISSSTFNRYKTEKTNVLQWSALKRLRKMIRGVK